MSARDDVTPAGLRELAAELPAGLRELAAELPVMLTLIISSGELRRVRRTHGVLIPRSEILRWLAERSM